MDYPEDVYVVDEPTNGRVAIRPTHGEVRSRGSQQTGPLQGGEGATLDAGVFFMGLEMVNKLYYFFRPGEDISSAIDMRAITAGKPDDTGV